MLFLVEMTVDLPADMDPDTAAELKARERSYAQELQRAGTWRHLWRVAGRYANVSVFDVQSNDELHDRLTRLPLYPYLRLAVTPLCRHPSSIREDDG